MKRSLVALLVVAALPVFAYDESDYLKWMRLKSTDNKNVTSFTRANWYDPEAEVEVLEAPVAGKCYYVPKDIGLWTHSTEGQTFVGQSLAIAGMISFRRYSVDYVVNDLRLLPGGRLEYASNANVKGNVTIEGTAEKPSVIYPSTFSDRDFYLYMTVTGEGASSVLVGNNDDRARGGTYKSSRYYFYSGRFSLMGSWTGYLGKTTFKKGTHVAFGGNFTGFGGPVEVEGNCILESTASTGAYSVPDLTLDEGAELRFAVSQGSTRKFTISRGLSIPGDFAYVSLSSIPSANSIAIMTLTDQAAEDGNIPDVSKLRIQPAMVDEGITELPRNSRGVVVDNGDGTKTVKLVWDDVLSVADNTILKPSETSGTIAHDYLRFGADSGILFKVVAAGSVVYEVSKGIEFADEEGQVKIGMTDLNCSTRECTIDDVVYQYLDLFKLTGDAALDANLPDLTKFVYADEYKFGELPRNPRFILVDGENGAKIVRLIWDRIWYMTTGNSYPDGRSAFDPENGSYWHTGILPPKDVPIDMINTQSLYFREYGTVSWPELTLNCFVASFCNAARDVKIKKVNICGDMTLNTANINDQYPHILHAPIEVFGKTLTIGGWGNRRGQFNGPISGTGKLAISHGPAIAQIFNGDNSGFKGIVSISGDEVEREVRDAYSYCQLGHANALGGVYEGDATLAWMAHNFSNVWFTCAQDVNLTEATRGVRLYGFTTFEVNDGKTLTITESATYGGTIAKRGAGTLVLGSPSVKFISGPGQTDTPQEGNNQLKIAAGQLKVTNANAVNGLQVSFAEGTKLILSAAPEGELATYGLKNTAWATPFVTDAPSGKIAVEFEGVPADKESSVPICSIAATATLPEFDVPTTYGKRTVTTAWRENGEGVMTLYADISGRPGLFIIIK